MTATTSAIPATGRSAGRRGRVSKAPRAASRQNTAAPVRPWLVGPAFDLLFLANAAWPLLVLLAVATVQVMPQGGITTHPGLSFWQIYFLTTPHRWITLALVFFDGERFWQRRVAFVGVALTLLLVIGAVWLSTGTLALLLLTDFVWNAWHYASQHSGISRIYARVSRPGVQTKGWFEKIVLRVFVMYAIFRLPLWAFPQMNRTAEDVGAWPAWVQSVVLAFYQALEGLGSSLQWADLLVLVLPAALLVNEVRRFRPAASARLIYLTSVCALYGSLLVSVHSGLNNRVLLGLFLAVSMFHATEYMAIVSWSVWKRHEKTPETLFGQLVPRWGVAILTFMAVLAATSWMMDRHYFRVWLVITIFVSYLHYAYDGMIWKVRRPASAAVA